MKIEDIKYTLPTEQIDVEGFDKAKWLKENPIDYFKYLYILFTSNNITPNLPSEIVMKVAFDALYSATRLYIPDTLYKFYSLSSNECLNKKKFKALQNKQIFMSDIKDFNDPFDCKAFFYIPEKLKDINRLAPHNGKYIDDFSTFYKGAALTENNTGCMPMWAYYSNNHQGFCIAYDMKDSANLQLGACTFPVQYTEERLDITSFMKKYASMVSSEVDKQIAEGKKEIGITDLSLIYMALFLCNIKHSTWQYEKEFRCTIGAKAKTAPYVNANPKAIYIGMNCCKKHREKLIKIAKELSVPIYQMRLEDLSEKYSLKEVLIEAN
ncbi:MAG: DUF2971 domain-containing protein [Clostridia bacterium]|nr:DUF2971 domain-containing protein [Clostridia bacterium]